MTVDKSDGDMLMKQDASHGEGLVAVGFRDGSRRGLDSDQTV